MGILGIDLGTTNSLIAFYDEEGAHIIPNRLGENLTPSCVSINEQGEIFVGRIAKERMLAHTEMTAANFKRYMGSNKQFKLGEKAFLAEELSSFIIRSLVEDAAEYLKEEITEVIISVPAYFNDVQRKATQRAGELSGLKVERLINEPTAAAIAYGLQEQEGETRFLIIDLGGGTFDVSILELDENIMEVRGVAGDNFLGGEDFTELLVSMFLDKAGLKAEEASVKELLLIRNQAELAKKSGSDVLIMRCKIGETDYEVRLEENEYEQAAKGLLLRLRKPIERALSDAAIKIGEIDKIVLVGGATKLPILKRFISKLFKKFPLSNINPDEVVALGTAIQAAMKERNKTIKEIVLTDVCPYTLGTDVCITRDNGKLEAGHFFPIIERNTIIPVSRVKRFNTTYENQKNIRIEVLQGESRYTQNNIMLGEINVPVPMAPAGRESVDVRYTYDINGILEVEVEVISTHVKKRMVIEQNPGYMSNEEVENRLRELEKIKIHPRDQEENKLLLARGERMYEENIGEVRRFIGECLERFEDALEYQDKLVTKDAVAVFKRQLDSVEQEWF